MKNDNAEILARMRGLPAQSGTPESDSDPRNPNAAAAFTFDAYEGLTEEELKRRYRQLVRAVGDAEVKIERLTARAESDAAIHADQLTQISGYEAENGRLRAALRIFVGCAYPAATEINPRGHNWRPEESLDYALSEANKALGTEQSPGRSHDNAPGA